MVGAGLQKLFTDVGVFLCDDFLHRSRFFIVFNQPFYLSSLIG